MRLNKLLSERGVASRRAAEAMILEGRVTVNGVKALRPGDIADPDKDEVLVDGGPLPEKGAARTIVLYKPVSVMTTLSDPQGRRTVRDLLPQDMERIVPVGRLDYDTEGALLLTGDGALCHALTHPSRGAEKIYIVRIGGPISDSALSALRGGVMMEGESRPTAPALVERVRFDGRATDVRVTLHEGRNRQVRRIMEAVGARVLSLVRVSFAGITLQGLRPGEWRDLTPHEAVRLRAYCREDAPATNDDKKRQPFPEGEE